MTAPLPFAQEPTLTRAEQRKQRLLEAESELAREEAEALKMTEEQRQILIRPFLAVKAEFSDLDGLRWTQTALRKFQSPQRRALQSVATSTSQPPQHSKTNSTFVVRVLNSASDEQGSEDATVRHSASTPAKSRTPLPTIVPPTLTKVNANVLIGTDLPARRRDGKRARSPIKGLFSRETEQSTSNAIRVSLPDTEADITDCDSPLDSDESDLLTLSTRRLCRSGPPGLSPAPQYEVEEQDVGLSPSKCQRLITANDFPLPPKSVAGFPRMPPKDQQVRTGAMPFPMASRDAPSPPAIITTPADATVRSSSTPRSTRNRLQSLLSTSPGSTSRASKGIGAPTPLELSNLLNTVNTASSQHYGDDWFDDDETPRPSPVSTDLAHSSPAIPWIQSFN